MEYDTYHKEIHTYTSDKCWRSEHRPVRMILHMMCKMDTMLPETLSSCLTKTNERTDVACYAEMTLFCFYVTSDNLNRFHLMQSVLTVAFIPVFLLLRKFPWNQRRDWSWVRRSTNQRHSVICTKTLDLFITTTSLLGWEVDRVVEEVLREGAFTLKMLQEFLREEVIDPDPANGF